MPESTEPTTPADAARASGLERHVLELELDGLTVVPPEVHGVTPDRIDCMVDVLLRRAEALTGSAFSVERGPHEALAFPGVPAGTPGTSQFVMAQVSRLHRELRDLAVNPVALALIRHLLGAKATRFSNHLAFVKWQDAEGYGPSLGMHADQTGLPEPWGRAALSANTNWCLTDYTREGGALAYVPGSHRRGTDAVFPAAVEQAVPVEAPKGSLIVFHGATWHGAYARTIPGLRLSVTNYYRHTLIKPQDDMRSCFPLSLADDCSAPEEFRTLVGYDDLYPLRDDDALSAATVPRVAVTQ